MGDDPHVPLQDGADLLHVVGDMEPLGGVQHQRGPAPAHALLNWPGPPHASHQPHLDPQEDHAAPQPCGLELQK